jgi:hypothetical protein
MTSTVELGRLADYYAANPEPSAWLACRPDSQEPLITAPLEKLLRAAAVASAEGVAVTVQHSLISGRITEINYDGRWAYLRVKSEEQRP